VKKKFLRWKKTIIKVEKNHHFRGFKVEKNNNKGGKKPSLVENVALVFHHDVYLG
jgi:hypothetical protein